MVYLFTKLSEEEYALVTELGLKNKDVEPMIIADATDFNFTYNANNTATVTGLSSTGKAKIAEKVTTLMIPEEIEYEGNIYTVAIIGAIAFHECTNIETLRVPWNRGAVANAPWGLLSFKIIYADSYID